MYIKEVERRKQSVIETDRKAFNPLAIEYKKLSLRRGGGLKRSSKENVRAVEPDGIWGLLRLKIDGFLIPNRLKIDFRESLPGVVTFADGCDPCIIGLFAAPATCNCSRNDIWWWCRKCVALKSKEDGSRMDDINEMDICQKWRLNVEQKELFVYLRRFRSASSCSNFSIFSGKCLLAHQTIPITASTTKTVINPNQNGSWSIRSESGRYGIFIRRSHFGPSNHAKHLYEK